MLNDIPDQFVVEEADEDAEPVLLDTDVFSFLLKGSPASDPWIALVEGKYLLLCFATVANDAWIAASARLYGVPLATGNAAHYTGIAGLDLVRP